MKNIQYPLQLKFKIGTLANDFEITDATGFQVGYVRQKMFKFVEEIQVFNDSSKTELFYTIKANKWIDFSAAYIFTNANGENVGRVARKGWASIWRTRYNIYDGAGTQIYHIRERNAWVKVWDALFSEIPILGILTGYVFNPKYDIQTLGNETVATLQKNASFFGRSFTLSKEGETVGDAQEENLALSAMMMILLERRRG